MCYGEKNRLHLKLLIVCHINTNSSINSVTVGQFPLLKTFKNSEFKGIFETGSLSDGLLMTNHLVDPLMDIIMNYQ